MFRGITKIHFIGIGGIGMSGIAELLLNMGFEVLGSDIADSDTVRRLKGLGAQIHIGHNAANIGAAQVVVYSSAVRLDNPECVAARERGLPVIPRAEMLAEIMRLKHSIAVAGTHGKTTTTSMLATILAKAGQDPTALIGGKLDMFDSNARLGEGSLLVAEADESDRSFLKLLPVVTIVTNIEEEHMDCYRDLDDICATYIEFLNKVPFYGFNIVCLDDANIRTILPRLERKVYTYGSDPAARYRLSDVRFAGCQSTFTVHQDGQSLGQIRLQVPGMHNCLNALAAVACALRLGIEFEVIKAGIQAFGGVQRRFHFRGEKGGIMVMDDYAHHPTEIRATLAALKNAFPQRRTVAVFQPHRYSRTRDLFDDFLGAFDDTQALIVTEIYPASEAPIAGISGQALYARMSARDQIDYVADKNDLPAHLQHTTRPGDIVIFLGAGDAWRQGLTLLERLA